MQQVMAYYKARLGKPIPSEFFCLKPPRNCGYIAHEQREKFTAWAVEEERTDLLSKGKRGWYVDNMLMCRCSMAAEAQAQAQAQRKAKRYYDANLPKRDDPTGAREFKNFETRPGTGEMLEACWDMAQGKGPPAVLLVGLTGCGKSHLLESTLRHALDDGRSVRYEVASGLLNRLRHTYSDGADTDISDLENWYAGVGVLAIDELSVDKTTVWGQGHLCAIVDRRLADGAPLLVATNCEDADAMAEVWGDRLASRLFDQHSGTVRVVWSEATDYRLTGGKG